MYRTLLVWLSGNNTYYYNIYTSEQNTLLTRASNVRYVTHLGVQTPYSHELATCGTFQRCAQNPIPGPMPFIFVPVTDIPSVARAWGARCTGVERALHERGARVARP